MSCHVATFAKDLGEVMSCRVATFARNLETYDINICLNSRDIYGKPNTGVTPPEEGPPPSPAGPERGCPMKVD